MTKPTRSYLPLLAAALAIGAPVPARANEYACKDGVEETTYARATYVPPEQNIYQLRGELDAWADEQGIGRGGSGSYDPKTHVHTWTIIMGPEGGGVDAMVDFTTENNFVQVSIENVCWRDKEDWHPLWTRVISELRRRGYRPK
jgi:hypothetical protein